MAEVLIRRFSAPAHPDPAVDARERWRRGYVVDVQEDGVDWGRALWPAFLRIRLPGVPADRLRKYLQPWEDPLVVEGDPRVRRRRWRLRLDDIPRALAQKVIQAGGVLTISTPTHPDGDVTWADVRTYLRDDMTGADEEGDL